MVRFNDKTQISSLASNDIMPITDMSDTTDDRKVTVQQLSQFAVDNIPTLSGGKTLTDNNLTNDLKDNYDTAYENQDLTKYDSTVSYPKGYWVTGIIDDQKVVKESLVDGNLGNPLTDDTKWKDVALGGGGGLEIGDIGIAPLGINEAENKRRYLNGQVIIADQYTSFAEKLDNTLTLYPNLAKTESEWQAISALSVGGQCGYFVVDKTAGTIRLPKIVMPIQGLTDLSKLGDLIEAGLPNITGKTTYRPTNKEYGMVWYDGSGAFSEDKSIIEKSFNDGTGGATSDVNGTLILDASLSNPIYGASQTVQQEQIQYPYFIQVATGVEESIPIINQLELNNPYTLLECKYSETILNNVSWLRSEGQWNDRSVYQAVYTLLLNEYNTPTREGLSVKMASESYDDYDFVVNTSDETFRLPIKAKYILPSDSNVAVKGNGMTLGFATASGNNEYLVTDSISNQCAFRRASNYGKVGEAGVPVSSTKDVLKLAGVSTDSSKSGIVGELNEANLYLYYYVGETVQNANLINAGRIEEKLVSVIPDNKELITSYCFPSKTYINLTLGASNSTYIAPDYGWILVDKNMTAGKNIVVWNNTRGYGCSISSSATFGQAVILPVCKGDEFKVEYTTTGATNFFRFFYAEGAK